MIAGVSTRRKVCFALEEFLEVLVLLVYFAKTVFQEKNTATGASLPKSSETTSVRFQHSLPRQPEKGLFIFEFLRRLMYLVQPQEGVRGIPLLERAPCSFTIIER